MLRFPNPQNNEWINKYNDLIEAVESGKIIFGTEWMQLQKAEYPNQEEYRIARLRLGKTTLHHIIPKKVNPGLMKDKNNLISVPFKEHMDLHYYLWRFHPYYGVHLWFGCIFGRKHGLWDLPGGDEEYEKLKEDIRLYRQGKLPAP